MRKILLGVAGLIALSAAPALAADLPARPYKVPAMIAAVYDWSGFYVGLNGGGSSSHKCWDLTNDEITLVGPIVPAVREGCHNASGGVAGGQMGFRWQSGTWVFGVDAQGDWANLKGSNTSLFYGAGTTNRSKIDAFGLLTGQAGYAWDNVLFYVKGGGAIVDDRYDGIFTATGVNFDSARENRWGGVVGGGIEFGFAPNWSVAVEYDHLFMGTRNVNFNVTATGAFSRNDRISQDVDIGTVRVNYRWGGPVIAKY